MKKAIRRLLSVSVLLALALSLCASAAAASKEIDIYVNGDLLNIPPSFGEPFYDENGRLQIPMRYIIQSCGYDVVWNSGQQTATVPTKTGDVVITLGSNVMKTPKGNVTMDTSAMAKDNRTYIPLRFALEALGFQVNWTGGAADRVDITGQIGSASKRVPMTAAEVSAAAAPAVFYIEVAGLDKVPYASGSGFFIDPTCIGVTNYHVIEGAYSATMTTTDGATYEMGMVLYYDKERDIAVFDALPTSDNATYGNVPYLNLATPSSIHNGDVCYAIGSPYGLQNSITDGLVSNKDRIIPGDPLSYIQTSAPISPGNSGGPLLNQYGEVIGINSGGLTVGQNINLAVPVSDLEQVDYKNQDNWKFLFEVSDREVGFAQAAAVQPPVNIRIVNQTSDRVYLQWDPVEGADYYHFYYQEAGDNSFWYDNDDTYPDEPLRFPYHSDYTVEYYGLKTGHTYRVIITAVKGGVESADSEIFTFTFQGTGQSTGQEKPANGNRVVYYSDAYWAPDFGAVSNATLTYKEYSNGFYNYFYTNFTADELLNYFDLLESLGYTYSSSEDDTMFFYQATTGHGLMTGMSNTGELIIITQ